MKCPNCSARPFKFGQFITSLSLSHHCSNCHTDLEPNVLIILGLPITILAAITVSYALLVWPPEALVRIIGGATILAAFVSAPLTVIFGLTMMYRFGRYKPIDSAKADLKD